MNARNLFAGIALLFVFGIFGASRGLAHMRQSYEGSCVQLGGIPGLLQEMHFFAVGDCALKKNNTQCDKNGSTCTLHSPSGDVSGTCHNGPGGCQCVAQ